MSKPICDVSQIRKSFPQPGSDPLHILKDVNFTAYQGEWLGILGRSGSGKSTLLNLLAGLDTPDTGTITLNQQVIHQLTRRKLDKFRATHIGLVFQAYHLLPELNALENIMLANYISTVHSTRKDATQLLDKLGLQGRHHHTPAQLSGGERQRVAIARALINKPSIILADEPTGNLDGNTRRDILNIFGQLRDEQHTLLMVTHDQDIAKIANRTILLKNGKIEDS